MRFTPTRIPEVVLIEPRIFRDHRGFFMETWQSRKFAAAGIHLPFVQDNYSHSRQGTLRGLHYQIMQPQGKLIQVLAGEIFDVVVDIRRSSPTFGQWAGLNLSADHPQLLWIPPGFAHGFFVLSEKADFLYKCTDYYAPVHERAIRWDDHELNITWPLPPGVSPLLSASDAAGKPLRDAEVYP